MKCVFKRIRKGAYQCMSFLVVRTHWLNERWDGPQDKFHEWQVYRSGSFIERRVLVDAFRDRRSAFAFVERRVREIGEGQ